MLCMPWIHKIDGVPRYSQVDRYGDGYLNTYLFIYIYTIHHAYDKWSLDRIVKLGMFLEGRFWDVSCSGGREGG